MVFHVGFVSAEVERNQVTVQSKKPSYPGNAPPSGSIPALYSISALKDIEVQDDGKVLLLDSDQLIRLKPDLSSDPSFGASGFLKLTDPGLFPEKRFTFLDLLPGGTIQAVSKNYRQNSQDSEIAPGDGFSVARYDAGGNPDAAFGLGGSADVRCPGDGTNSYLSDVSRQGGEDWFLGSCFDGGSEKPALYETENASIQSRRLDKKLSKLSGFAVDEQGNPLLLQDAAPGYVRLIRLIPGDRKDKLVRDPHFLEGKYISGKLFPARILPRSDGKIWLVTFGDRHFGSEDLGWQVYLLGPNGEPLKSNLIPSGDDFVYRMPGALPRLALRQANDDLLVFYHSGTNYTRPVQASRIRRDGSLDPDFKLPFVLNNVSRALVGKATADGRVILAVQRDQPPVVVTGFQAAISSGATAPND